MEIEPAIAKVREGDTAAYGVVVREFQGRTGVPRRQVRRPQFCLTDVFARVGSTEAAVRTLGSRPMPYI